MDFLKIRKKARERSRGGSAAEGDPRPAEPASPPAVTGEDVPEGALARRSQGLPPADDAGPSPAPEEAARFTTWRPGTGEPPVPPPEPGPPRDLAPRPEDFALVTPAAVAGDEPWRPQVRIAPSTHRRHPEPPGAGPLPAPPPGDPLDEFFFREDEVGPALPELAPAEGAPAPASAPLVREEFLTFLLGAEEYAVPIGRVREVVRCPPITEVPRAPAHVLGVVTVRGEVVAVFDPRGRLGLPRAAPAEGEGKIVIVDPGDGICGLHVDGVASVVRLPPGAIEPCPQGLGGQRSEFLAGIGRDADRLFTVLDLGALLRRPPARPEPRARRSDAPW
jgi:purine-binding chemotaxis protein CheW